jgi:hypothetical protein
VAGATVPETLDLVRELFRCLGRTEDAEEEARKLRHRKQILFPGERRLVLGVEVAEEEAGLRVYTASVMA